MAMLGSIEHIRIERRELYRNKVAEALGTRSVIVHGNFPNFYVVERSNSWMPSLVKKENLTELEVVYIDFINSLTDEIIDAAHLGKLNWNNLNSTLQTGGVFSKFYQISKKSLNVFVPFSLVILNITQVRNETSLSTYYLDLINEYNIAFASDNTLPEILQSDIDFMKQSLYDSFFDITLFGFNDENPLILPTIP